MQTRHKTDAFVNGHARDGCASRRRSRIGSRRSVGWAGAVLLTARARDDRTVPLAALAPLWRKRSAALLQEAKERTGRQPGRRIGPARGSRLCEGGGDEMSLGLWSDGWSQRACGTTRNAQCYIAGCRAPGGLAALQCATARAS